MDHTVLKDYGINYENGLARCLNDESFYEQFLSMFLQDTSFDRARDAYDAGDLDALFRCLHELKGISGNAALTELFEAVCPLVDLLRGGSAEQQSVDALFAAVVKAYDRARAGVSLATGK